MRINYGWGYAFFAAGIGMLLGLIIFMAGTKHIKEADVLKPVGPKDMSLGRIFGVVLLPMLAFGALGWIIPGNIFGTDANDAFLIGCLPVIGFFIYLMVTAEEEDKKPIKALLAVFATIIVFWAVFHQNGDALTVWAEDYTNREMPASVATVAEKADMAQIVTNNGATTDEKSAKYFANLPKDQIPTEGKSLKLFSTELYQSINPFWVVLLTPILVGFWGFLRKRNSEPSTPMKIALGLLITALSAFVMFAAVKATNMDGEKASSWWLIMSYGVITVGELCLSPMGLSLVSKLSPPRITALMMGGFFLSTAVGNKLSGMLSGLWEGFDDKSNFFLMNFFLVFAAFVVMFVLVKWLAQIMKERNIH
jgi:POT family proton-dependent oligopeptide transporter